MLRMFKSRMLRKMFGPTEEVVMGDWRKVHNVELHEYYAPPTDQIQKDEMCGEYGTYGET
jgi:hypothetical protein